MEETRAVATVDDLPNELLVRLVPDLKPKTISALKLVNKRFYDVISDDIYFKAYLRWPEKYYLCEMKCEKNSGKNTVDEIKSGSVGKFKGYLTLQNLHLDNMRSGRITDSEIVHLPRMSDDFDAFCIDGVRWHDLVDEDNERWACNLRRDGSIILVNLTNEPKFYVEKEMYGVAAECVRLLNGQVLCISYNMRHVVVLDIVYDQREISLMSNFDFQFDTLDFKWIPVTGKCKTNQASRNLFVTFREHPVTDGMLHFRDLKTGNFLEDIYLWNYECLKRFRGGPSGSIIFRFNEFVDYPNILMTIGDQRNGDTVVCSLDVDKREPNLFVVMSNESLTKSCIINGVAYIFTSTFDRQSDVDSVKVHRFPLGKHSDIEPVHLGKPLCHFKCKTLFDANFFTPGKFAFIDHKDHCKVHVMTISDCDVNDVEIRLDIDGEYCCLCMRVFGDMLFVHITGKNENIFSLNVTEPAAGEVVNWKKTISEKNIGFRDPWPIRSMDRSKLVFYDRNDATGGVDLVVFYF